ncbi:aspartyl protease family protein [Paraburkholderia sp. BL21I4N1]|uniref:aspartyl protease family protein n=1 Tax=Paraburkholderia sp. BL21I4N1 TaxID=1938801 RepID=UPI000D4A3D09|nr:aspartyl protease family protein [Paraburkholderia sp. BL21I4N1]PQV49758.1 aspartyl protease [Paraburkholderia sp. BL21I4N1]
MRLAKAAFLALVCLSGSATHSAPAYVRPQPGAFPLSIIDNRPFIAVKVNEKGPFSFILDTGSSSSTVSTALTEKLKLAGTSAGNGMGAGEQPLSFKIVHLSDLSVGPFSVGALDAPSMDTSPLNRIIGFQHFDGVLGTEIFKKYVLTLDAARQQVTIQSEDQFKPAVDAIAIPFSLDENAMPVVHATVAGVPGLFQVDTGDRFSLTLFGAFWRAHRLDEHMGTTVEAMTGYGGGGPIRGIVGRPARFSIGDIPVPAPVTRLSLQKAGAFVRGDRAGSIGMGILKRFTASFDYGHHVIWLSKGPGFNAPDLYDRSGMWLGLSQQRGLGVIDVTANGPAARAGLRAGDTIVEVGALRAEAGTLFRIRAMLEEPNTLGVPILVNRANGDQPIRLVLQDLISP